MAVELKVMTFNLRIRARSDGENMFDFRKPYILDVINGEKPDLIGFQEANDEMADFLKQSLPEYYFLGYGREANYHGEAPMIAYRWDTFYLHTFSEEMLSLVPQVQGSRMDGVNQSRCPRAFACAELIHRESSNPIAVYNVHTDHWGQDVVYTECVMLMQSIGRRAMPFILTGDFNATPDTPAIAMIRASKDVLGTVDATEEIKTSFHNYGRKEEDFKIDYIFTNLPTDPTKSYSVPNPEGKFYSDHYALCAMITLE